MNNQNFQKGNLYLIIAIIVGVFAISAVGFASWKYFGSGSELEKETQPVYSPEKEKTVPEMKKQEEIIPSEKVDETADWKTYQNENGGYIIKYPSNWMIISDWKFVTDATDMGINFCGPEYSSKTECSAGGKGDNPVIKLGDDMLDYKEEGFCVQNKENIFCKENLILSQKYIKIAGRDGIITEFKDINNGSIYASWKENSTDEKLFSLSVVGLKKYSNYRDVFNQMLSTFKFTE